MESKRIRQDSLNNGGVRLGFNTILGVAPRARSLISSAYCSSLILCLLAAGCASTPSDAPVRDARIEPQAAGQDPATQAPDLYVVQKGDTFYSIARHHAISQSDLAEWNNILDPAAIYIGQQLSLSSPTQTEGPSLFQIPEPSAPSVPMIAPDTVSPSQAGPRANTDRLKTEPKAFKLPYSEQAIAQLKGLPIPPPAIVVTTDDPITEKNTAPELAAMPPVVQAAPEVDRVEWIWPTRGRILGGFSEATKGIDIAGESGQPVIASAGGKVVYSGSGLRGYGRLIIIKHNNTYLSAYAHNNKILVKEGETVAKGQKIAEMGNTDTDLVKLHFEIRKNGKPVDPLEHLPGISG
ncbi:MAG: peptidoglycan DD-metalloendopeptidase family protein [Nitrosospira sp.]|nr:peptidoglycan DD-metalloendopeptidase family protein [Nitrosospira sp.]